MSDWASEECGFLLFFFCQVQELGEVRSGVGSIRLIIRQHLYSQRRFPPIKTPGSLCIRIS